MEWPANTLPAGSGAQAAASGRGSVFAGAAPRRRRTRLCLAREAFPVWPRAPRCRRGSPRARRWRNDFVSPPAEPRRPENRAFKIGGTRIRPPSSAGRAAHAQNGLRCPRPGLARGGRPPRRGGGAGLRGDSRTPRSAARPTWSGRRALSSRRVRWGKAPGPGRQRCREREVILCGRASCALPTQRRSLNSLFPRRGSCWSLHPLHRRPRFIFQVAQCALVFGFVRVPSTAGGAET